MCVLYRRPGQQHCLVLFRFGIEGRGGTLHLTGRRRTPDVVALGDTSHFASMHLVDHAEPKAQQADQSPNHLNPGRCAAHLVNTFIIRSDPFLVSEEAGQTCRQYVFGNCRALLAWFTSASANTDPGYSHYEAAVFTFAQLTCRRQEARN